MKYRLGTVSKIFYWRALLQQGILEPVFYGDLVYNLNELLESLIKKVIKRYKRVGYNMDILRQSARVVINPIMVDSYGFLFNYMTLGQASDLMMALT